MAAMFVGNAKDITQWVLNNDPVFAFYLHTQ
jgi:hypothetical protein